MFGVAGILVPLSKLARWRVSFSTITFSKLPSNSGHYREIDVFEGVNLQQRNQMALHTNPGCKQVNPNQSVDSSFIPNTDCSYLTNNNQGCIVNDPDVQSYGAEFANAGGGVWVTEYAESGISYVLQVFSLLSFFRYNIEDLFKLIGFGSCHERKSPVSSPPIHLQSTLQNLEHPLRIGQQEAVI